jgi:pyridoxamine 5'-phosphate oxidase
VADHMVDVSFQQVNGRVIEVIEAEQDGAMAVTNAPGSGPDPADNPSYAERRVSYQVGTLTDDQLAVTPLEQFERWYEDAVAAALPEPNAMMVATVDAAGRPSARTVLLKQADPRGFVFYTNYGSRKGLAIEAGGGAVALVFPWHPLQRQICVLATAERVPAEETRAYFGQRPWGSRIGAWASHQSAPIEDRALLESRFAELAERWPDHGRPDDVPVPETWGGYVLRPSEVEFWQGRPSRLHDRLAFVAASGSSPAMDDAAGWRVERRQP